jgi:glc operon protein GlcG
MRIRILMGAVLGAVMLAGSAYAQAPATPPAAPPAAAPSPLDNIPDKMPFAEPYGAPISLGMAHKYIVAAIAEADKRGWKMNVTVVDSGGNLVAFERMDGAQLASISISEHKARAAVMYRRETKIFENAIQKGGFLYVMTLDNMIGSRGGFPIIRDGKIVGGLGCSGGTGSQDEAVCKTALDSMMMPAKK